MKISVCPDGAYTYSIENKLFAKEQFNEKLVQFLAFLTNYNILINKNPSACYLINNIS